MDTQTAGTGWAALLRDFTRRNAGRPTLLEIDAPDLGAQWQEVNLPLQGVDYDPREGRVDVIVGAPDGQRLTHAVAGVTAIDVEAADGRDRTLRLVG
jgi:hypothetical protein